MIEVFLALGRLPSWRELSLDFSVGFYGSYFLPGLAGVGTPEAVFSTLSHCENPFALFNPVFVPKLKESSNVAKIS